MKNILFLATVLLLPSAAAWVTNRVARREIFALQFAARLGLALVLFVTGSTHFVQPRGMSMLLPEWVPARIGIVLVTGFLEILAGIGLLWKRTTVMTGGVLVVFFVAIFPANVWAAWNEVDFGGHALGPAYLIARGPLQLLLIVWSWRIATEGSPRRSFFGGEITHGRKTCNRNAP